MAQIFTEQRWRPLLDEFIKPMRIDSKEVAAVDERGSPLNLWRSQTMALDFICSCLDDNVRMMLWLKSRQIGMTTITLVIDLFFMAMYPGLIGALVADDDKNSIKNRAKLTRYIASFPKNFLGGFKCIKNNKHHLLFNNGSRLDLLVAGKSKVNWGEGEGYVLVHMTEASKYGQSSGIDNFMESFSETHPNRLCMIESTANGYNHYKAMWEEYGSDQFTKRRQFLGWWSKELNVITRADPRWLQFGVYPPNMAEQERIDLVEKLSEWRITPEQLAWYRWRESNPSADEGALAQNQPWCVVAGTRVGTDYGILPIEKCRPGMVSTLGTVIASMPTGQAPIWTATTRLGYQIRGTSNHPLIRTDGSQVDLSESLGSEVKLQGPRFANGEKIVRWQEGIIFHEVKITHDFSRLVGLFLGDGSISGQGPRSGYEFSIACSGRDRDTADEVHRLLRELFGVEAQERHTTPSGNQGGCIVVRVTSRLIYDTFKKLGLIRTDTGKSMRKIQVPDFIWESPKTVVKEFLSGLFEADGFNGFRGNRVIFCTKWPAFAREIQLLLLGFGITSRFVSCTPKIGAKTYSAVRIELRSEESRMFNENIGFLSARKKGRYFPPDRSKKWKYRKPNPVVMFDHIETVVNDGASEEVFNLTIDGDHLFDANGIVTHNTASEAFVMSGFSFFQIRKVQTDIDRVIGNPDDGIEPVTYKAYRYHLGEEIFSATMERITDASRIKEVELRVWEEPVKDAQYVIGCDPAFGRNDWADRSAISVWRCFADKMVQVAEYATPDPETRQIAWVLAHLAGAYKNCIVNIELGGPGHAVFTEWNAVRSQLRAEMFAQKVKDLDWEDFLDNARQYLYHRPDSMGAGYAYHTQAGFSLTHRMLNHMRDMYSTYRLIINSLPMLEEMSIVTQDGSHIGAPKGQANKDDRVFAAALAILAYKDWLEQRLIAEGYTYEVAMRREHGNPNELPNIVDRMVGDFFRRAEERANMEPEPDAWLQDRGFE